MRASIFYLLSLLALSVYGGQVCPYLDSLGFSPLFLQLGSWFALAFLARLALWKRWVGSSPLVAQPRQQFFLDLGLYMAVGLALTTFDTLHYHFPPGSGLKLMLGCATLGLFAAVDLALDRERRVLDEVMRAESAVSLAAYTSVSRKLAWIGGGTVGLATLDILLVVNRDLDWIVTVGPDGLQAARQAVVAEVLFVISIIFLLSMNLLFSFSRNLKRFFDNETLVLERVAEGHLDVYVPVSSGDEFGLIARRTNQMIDGLRERNRIKQLFGKMVSPQVARQLLEPADDGLRPGGSRRQVVILFSDIRDFTARVESCPPEEVVNDLNRYFQAMVGIVHARGGLVDKFIGDGLMAVFGLDGPETATERAVQAALEMQTAVAALAGELSQPLEIGIGIHRGEAIAGIIGSPERLEFTFIGDAVNITSRLESLTRQLNASVCISGAVFDALEGEPRGLDWRSYGPQMLKGRHERVQVFALGRGAA